MRKLFFFVTVFAVANILAQTESSKRERKWQIGIGTAVVKFSNEDAAFIGDKNMIQIPRLNLTMPIGNNLSLDGAMSFNSFGVGFIDNSVKYFSLDGSVRYNFNNLSEDFVPYVFAGGSLVDSERKMTPTLNIGAGLTYWISKSFGLNTQVYYKHSLEMFESMRSHIQITGGIVYSFDIASMFAGKPTSSIGGACYFNQH
ncbi:outer membrane beta-barrel protein [uncultured Tenacibaculum sp.]|uniref:outer membrane beta-barrel protein n=1 Tax=uncultured Tenacibaculum sp. TaxID=174713 RepID=UPI002611C7F1|nr:outer membrane beta-barrel protein [uncultured Tenacibaculum sp.]